MVRPSTQPSSRKRVAKAAAHGAKAEALAPRNPIVGSLPVCCADVLIGHVAVAPTISVMNSRRLIASPEAQTRNGSNLRRHSGRGSLGDVRFGSKADICSAQAHVCFTPKSDREKRIPANGHVCFTPKADMCSATRDVRFGPKADIGTIRTVQ